MEGECAGSRPRPLLGLSISQAMEMELSQEGEAQDVFPEKQALSNKHCECLVHTREGGRTDSQGVLTRRTWKKLLDPGETEAGGSEGNFSRSFCESVWSPLLFPLSGWGLTGGGGSSPLLCHTAAQ